ncbi:MAG: DUF2188 domain-containing protein [Syntrophorhabdaceae bacterium]|nr:DUF2188 domain-containing protein [Syntrophorhabdaceae bacterium]
MDTAAERIVYKHHDGFWSNKLQGEKRPSTFHRTQEEAIASARDMLENEGGGKLMVRGEGGLIKVKDTVAPRKDSIRFVDSPSNDRRCPSRSTGSQCLQD